VYRPWRAASDVPSPPAGPVTLLGRRTPTTKIVRRFLRFLLRPCASILVDHARARAAAKRPRPDLQVTLNDALPALEPRSFELLSLDQAINDLAAFDARQARLVELRYFGIRSSGPLERPKRIVAVVGPRPDARMARLRHSLCLAFPA
jgi:hypothetical protein